MKIIKIEGCKNFRNIGGYKNELGEVLISDRFYRADALYKLSDKDINFFKENNLSTIIDLRNVEEIEKAPNIFQGKDGFYYYNIPLINKDIDSINRMDKLKDLSELYRYLLDYSYEELSKVFQIMLDSPNNNIIFHCTSGKDRTGVVAAMLLLLANVPKEKIIEDYSVSSVNMFGKIEEDFVELNGIKIPKLMLLSEPEYMEDFIDYVNKKYNGIRTFFKRQCGFQEEKINQLRAQLIL